MASRNKIFDLLDVLKQVDLENATSVNKNNFESVIEEYELPARLECLCSEGFKNICKQKHKHGFIVKLKDGSNSIVGNNCVKNKFEKDSDIRKSIIVHRRNKIFQERLGKLQEYKNNSNKLLEEINSKKLHVEKVLLDRDNFLKVVGKKTFTKLLNSSEEVKVESRTHKKDVLTKTTETIKTIEYIGSIKGKDFLYGYSYGNFFELIKSCEYGLKQLEKFSPENRPEERQVKIIEAKLKDFNDIDKQYKSILKSFKRFEKNELNVLLLAFKDGRYNLFKFYKPSLSFEQKRTYIQNLENHLKERFKSDEIVLLH